MPSYLLIRAEDSPDYDSFSECLFKLLKVEIKETRYSDNVSGGRYIRGECLGLKVSLQEGDDSEFPDHQFALVISPLKYWGDGDRPSLDGLADIVARFLAQHGLKVVRRLDEKSGGPRIEYGA